MRVVYGRCKSSPPLFTPIVQDLWNGFRDKEIYSTAEVSQVQNKAIGPASSRARASRHRIRGQGEQTCKPRRDTCARGERVRPRRPPRVADTLLVAMLMQVPLTRAASTACDNDPLYVFVTMLATVINTRLQAERQQRAQVCRGQAGRLGGRR